ncbi:MAG TPA: hypothetical protein VFJ94_16265 [Intrasporangium sp.]|uniref:hypothetical protein n=1 Tax=Intrasporangium sp. TaxID=1925024 RepID=UPI002D79DD73|nr:hypothetical protein [Intrasporangium sp.]HET7400070.1 hypothetical protein [Intrasporangium sp.]
MNAWLALPGKRLAATAVAGLSAVALLGGCGMETRQQAAAIVNGSIIRESDVRQTAEQLSGANLKFSENIVVTALIAAPLLKAQVDKSGSWKPDETYASVVAAIPNATETTKEFVSAVALLDSARMTPADVAGYRQSLQKAKITVNPKYGAVHPSDEGPVYFSLGEDQPNWIKPAAAGAGQ